MSLISNNSVRILNSNLEQIYNRSGISARTKVFYHKRKI